VLCHKPFPVNYAVCPQCIRLFSSYEWLQSSITAGHRAPTVGTDANVLSPVCVVFTHKCVSISNKSGVFFLHMQCYIYKREVLAPTNRV